MVLFFSSAYCIVFSGSTSPSLHLCLNADISSFIATMEMKTIELSAGGKAGTISDVNYVINVLAVRQIENFLLIKTVENRMDFCFFNCSSQKRLFIKNFV